MLALRTLAPQRLARGWVPYYDHDGAGEGHMGTQGWPASEHGIAGKGAAS